MLLSCRASNLGEPNGWSTYRNPRYNFEFPYPTHWKPFPIPDNLDGQAFGDPQEPSTQVRGWAGNNLSEDEVVLPSSPPIDTRESHQQNFTTEQGLTGKLQVDIGSEISLMKLTFSQGNVRYNWQGQCDSEQFDDYYRFFYYIARQYSLSSLEEDGE
ncbi:hypothetical protein IQ257_14670 [Coleofasciculus sp. LEGE 07092]|nr:hypothetical protein [Coleofasciculus sp. LEGE 07081]MBE9149719.1 hypothetical protein [Coleofasciculus sp. LEGE 07092]